MGLWNRFKNVFHKISHSIGSAITKVTNKMKHVFSVAGNSIKNVADKVYHDGKSVVQTIYGDIKDTRNRLFDTINNPMLLAAVGVLGVGALMVIK